MALRNIDQSAPIIWVAEWSPIRQGRPKNTIYQDYLTMRLKHDAQIENKVPFKISGIELMFACRRFLLHLNCGTNGSCIFLTWKFPNCVHIITKMAVKPVYTLYAEKHLPFMDPLVNIPIYSPFSLLFIVSVTFLISFWLLLFKLYYLEATDIFLHFSHRIRFAFNKRNIGNMFRRIKKFPP